MQCNIERKKINFTNHELGQSVNNTLEDIPFLFGKSVFSDINYFCVSLLHIYHQIFEEIFFLSELE